MNLRRPTISHFCSPYMDIMYVKIGTVFFSRAQNISQSLIISGLIFIDKLSTCTMILTSSFFHVSCKKLKVYFFTGEIHNMATDTPLTPLSVACVIIMKSDYLQTNPLWSLITQHCNLKNFIRTIYI